MGLGVPWHLQLTQKACSMWDDHHTQINTEDYDDAEREIQHLNHWGGDVSDVRYSRSILRSIARRQQKQQQQLDHEAATDPYSYARPAQYHQLPVSPMTSRGAPEKAWEALAIQDLCNDQDWVGLRMLVDQRGVSAGARQRASDLLVAQYGYAQPAHHQ